VIARALAESELEGDQVVAKRYGVKQGTIVAWRRESETNPELRPLYLAHARKLLAAWKPASVRAFVRACEALEKRIGEGKMTTPELIAAIRTLGELRVAETAVLGGDDAGAGDEGHPAPRDRGESSSAQGRTLQ